MRTFILSIATCIGLASSSSAQILFDDFNSSVIDSGKWESLTPLSDSQMTEIGGSAVFFQRGSLLSKQSLSTAIEVRGRFAFTGGDHDIFSVMLRSDGQMEPTHGQFLNGTLALFARRGGDDGDQTGQRNIYLTTGLGQITVLGIANFLFQQGVFYDFKIIDDGYSVQLFLEDMTTPLLSESTTYSAGQQVGIQNRGYVPWWPTYDNKVNLDFIQITAVPEPNSIAIFGLCSWLFFARRSNEKVRHSGAMP